MREGPERVVCASAEDSNQGYGSVRLLLLHEIASGKDFAHAGSAGHVHGLRHHGPAATAVVGVA
jgi:hypothetical protein